MALQPRVDALEQVAYDSERLALIRNLPDPKRKETLKLLAERGGTVNSEVGLKMQQALKSAPAFVGYELAGQHKPSAKAKGKTLVVTYLARRPIVDKTGFTHDPTEKRCIALHIAPPHMLQPGAYFDADLRASLC